MIQGNENRDKIGEGGNPLVSICCLSYNHAPFLKDCLNGFLNQEIDFPIEILIHDDASTDGSEEIIKEYAEKYPDIIYPLYETKNQYSNGCKGRMDLTFNYNRARGKYIAYCEGDDFWTDHKKLKKQVDFMESHPDYSVCFHRCSHLNTSTGVMTEDHCGRLFTKGQEGIDITAEMTLRGWITQPLTMVFRRSCFSFEWQKLYKDNYRDMQEIYHLLSAGKGYLFAFDGGVYRYHPGGINSMISQAQYCETSLPIDEEFYRINRTPAAKKNYLFTLRDCVNYYSSTNKLKAVRFIFKHLAVSHNLHIFVKQIYNLLKKPNAAE